MSVPPERPPVYPPPGNPVDQPTAPLDPVAPRQVPADYRADPYVADPQPAFWRLEALRTALTVVGLIALIAIGLAVWALIRADHNRRVVATGAPPTTAGTAALNRRVSNLEATVRSLRSTGGNRVANARSLAAQMASLQQSQKQLSSQEKQLASQVNHAGNSGQVSQLASKESGLSGTVSQLSGKESGLSGKVSQITGKEAALSGQVSQLQGRVSQLASQVSQLKGQATSQTGQTGSQTTTFQTTTTP